MPYDTPRYDNGALPMQTTAIWYSYRFTHTTPRPIHYKRLVPHSHQVVALWTAFL